MSSCVIGAKRVRTDLTPHIQTLQQYFAKGMCGATSAEQRLLIAQAQQTTQLSSDTIKEWINNYKKKLRRQQSVDTKKISCRKKRAYELFMSDVMKSDELAGQSLSLKMKLANDKWRLIKGTDAANAYVQQAQSTELSVQQAVRTSDQSDVSDNPQRNGLSRKQCSKLMKLMAQYQSSEHDCLVLFYDRRTKFLQKFGTEKAIKFIDSNSDVATQFIDSVEGSTLSSDIPSRAELRSRVCSLFNTRFQQTIGGNRCDYAAVLTGNIKVTGMPSNVSFRHPRWYGIQTMQKILAKNCSITFSRNLSDMQHSAGDASAESQNNTIDLYQLQSLVPPMDACDGDAGVCPLTESQTQFCTTIDLEQLQSLVLPIDIGNVHDQCNLNDQPQQPTVIQDVRAEQSAYKLGFSQLPVQSVPLSSAPVDVSGVCEQVSPSLTSAGREPQPSVLTPQQCKVKAGKSRKPKKDRTTGCTKSKSKQRGTIKIDRTPCLICEILFYESTGDWLRCRNCKHWVCAACVSVSWRGKNFASFICASCK